MGISNHARGAVGSTSRRPSARLWFTAVLTGALTSVGVMLYIGLERSAGIDASIERDWDIRAAGFLDRVRPLAAAAWVSAETVILDAAAQLVETRGIPGSGAVRAGYPCFVLDRDLNPVFPEPWAGSWVQVLEILPGDAEAWDAFSRAERLEFADGDIEGALSAYEAILSGERGPSLRARAGLAAAGAAAKLGRHEDAARLYGLVADYTRPAGVAPWIRATAAHRRARSLERTGNAQAAARALTALIEGLLDRGERSRFAGIEAARREFLVEIALEDLGRTGEVSGNVADPASFALRWEESRRADGILRAVRNFVVPAMQLEKDGIQRTRAPAVLLGKKMTAVVERRGDVFAGAFLDSLEIGDVAAAAAADPECRFDVFLTWENEPAPALRSRASVPLLDGSVDPRLNAALKDPSAPSAAAAGRKAGLGALLLIAGAALAGGTVLVLRRLKREMDLSRLRTDLLSSVSHDFRTPLTLIRSAAETLSMGRVQDPEKTQRYLDMIVKEVQRLDAMVGNVMDAVRFDTGCRSLRHERIDPAVLLAEAESSRRLYMEETGFVFEVDCEPGLPAVVGDAAALRSALYNLVDNAVKYSGDRKEVRLAARGAGGLVEISVEDRGPGIPESERERIFERFFRSKTVVEKIDGAGLGLAMAHEIARAHGGDLTFGDREGGGTRFVLSLPAAVEERGQE